jgi:alpha-tubulin suppressor-like RCC1 family protein
MKRHACSIIATAAALAAAACTDVPTQPAPDAPRFSADASHTWAAGGGSAWHGYHAPELAYDAAAQPLVLCATWSDASLFERDGGQYADTDFFAYDFFRQTNDTGEWELIGSASSRVGAQPGCHAVEENPTGTHTFRVTGMARHGTGRQTTTHHTLPATAEVTTGGNPPAGPPLVPHSISAGDYHSCGLTAEGQAWCWGHNAYAQLGDGTTNSSLVPVAVQTELRFARIAAGQQRTCAVTADGDAYCWGENYYGSVGNGMNRYHGLRVWTPAAVAGGHRFRSVSTGMAHSCGVTTDDVALCWGWGAHGQLGYGGTAESSVPVEVAGGLLWRDVTASANNYTCGVTTDDVAYCWGENNAGQFGDGTKYTKSSVPTPVLSDVRFRDIVPGSIHTCGIDYDNAAWCWGMGVAGRLGNGSTLERLTPVAVAGGHEFSSITVAWGHTCAVTLAGEALCWGDNGDGRLGIGSTLAASAVPVPVSGDLHWSRLDVGQHHSCGMTSAGNAFCWGRNAHGQVGDATTTNRSVPVPVSGWGGL